MSKRIKGITIELDGETKGLDKALGDVNKRSRDTAKELRDVERLLRFNPKNTELLAQKQKLLGDQVNTTREKLDQLKGAQAEVQRQFESGEIGEDQYRSFQREISETESKLRHYASQMEKTQSKLEQFGEKIGETGEKFKDAGKKMTDAGKSMSTKVTAPLVGLAGIATKVGSDFEAGMSKVAAVSGATGDDLVKLTEKAREMGATTQFSATESADALYYMSLAGWETEQMLGGIEGVMDLAAASGEDLASVSDIVTDSLSAFGLQAEESARLADVLASASANSNTDVAGLGESFKNVAPVAGALGLEVEDVSLALGLMANAGIKGSKSGTALRTMLSNMAKPTAAMEEEMEKLGISLTDSEGNMKSLDDVMQDMRGSFSELDEAEQAAAASTIFGKEAMAGALAVINASEDDYNKLSESINNSEGSANSMAETMQDNLQGRLKEMKSVLEDVAITLYENLQPALEFIIGLVKSVAEWFQNLSPTMQNTIVIIAGLAAAIGPLLIILGLMATGIGSIMTVISSLIALLPLLGTAFTIATGPIGLIIAAIALLVAIGIKLWKNWDTVSEKATEIWSSIAEFFFGLFENIKDIFNNALEWIDEKTLGKFYVLTDGIRAYMTLISDNIKAVWNFIKNTFKNATAFLKALVTGDFKGMKDAIKNQLENAKNLASNILQNIKDFFGNTFASISSETKEKFNQVKDNIMKPINSAKDLVKSAIDSIKGFFSGMNLKFPKIKMPKLPKFSLKGKFSLAPPSVPKLDIKWNAKGGIFNQPTLFNTANAGLQGVGEAGPEAILPLNSKVLGDIGKGIAETMGTGSNNNLVESLLIELIGAVKQGQVIKVNERVLGETVNSDQGKRISLSGRVEY